MSDGVRLAVDLLLPSKCGGGAAVPAVFIQCRYMRSAALRWPFSLMTRGLPVDFIGQELKTTLLAAGYAVVSIDVRGTGGYTKQGSVCSKANHNNDVMCDHILRSVIWPVASAVEPRGATGLSGGVGLDCPATVVLRPGDPALPGLDPGNHASCNLPQGPQLCEHQDLTRSAAQVILYGMSYEAGAALFTLAAGHPAVRGGVLMYPFWDLYTDISCPGGVPQGSFIRTWSRLSLGLDANNVGSLALLLKVFFRSAAEPQAPGEGAEIAYVRSLLQ